MGVFWGHEVGLAEKSLEGWTQEKWDFERQAFFCPLSEQGIPVDQLLRRGRQDKQASRGHMGRVQTRVREDRNLG